ncbi:hypothetical protein GobsT_25680 [Gemmata obscuriglobus]|uniref:IS66 family insertion sequence element accessory protein TnpA n=1 Tax=Gemmata obscuriglobus TaxID=114 RepID=UPI0011CD2E62|nr:hypothetical protein [Gemmata obscuriglobus]QEG27804.1 hypothetical protein GobsT_25680 [Gemmata obscuriglobus]VTS05134.1 Uncultured bacterium genome assembly Metasoil_fosmids_resub OS=uncultured bacterium PE=4 SV=1 [Gemmata obscuriglobus UQM 2246]
MSDSSARPRYHPAAARRWADRLERYAARPTTVAAFCAAEGVSPSNFYLWRRRLTGAGLEPADGPAVVPMHVAPPPAPAAPIELALPSGTVVRLPADAGPELVVAILRGLEGRPC